MLPLGLRTAIGERVGRLLITGVWSEPKLAVLPVSAMNGETLSSVKIGMGGPISGIFSGGNTLGSQVGRVDVFASLMSLFVLRRHVSVGFPPFHSLLGARGLRDTMRLQPAIMLSAVAVT